MRRIRLASGLRTMSLLMLAILALGFVARPISAKSPTTDVRLYFVVDGKIAATDRAIPSVSTIATETLTALFRGPRVAEFAIGQRSALPVGLTLNDPLKIDGASRTATVSLPSIFTSDSATIEAQRTAQIVYTLTQFPTVTSVAFMIDGKAYKPVMGDGKRAPGAVGRINYEAVTPVIFIESVNNKNPMHVSGTANVFEAEFRYELYDANNAVITKGSARASSGTGTRGTFSFDIDYSVKVAGSGTLVVYEQSAKDGSAINLSATLVTLRTK